MRLILLSLLTFVLVSCGEIRLELGSDDAGEVGEWVWTPTTVDNSTIGGAGYLTNTRTGTVKLCTSRVPASAFGPSNLLTDPYICRIVTSETLDVAEVRARNENPFQLDFSDVELD
jgi:hypothetical protein